jgi:hypothetical protein
MRKLFLMIIPAFICGLAFTGCNADEEVPKPITSDGLYVIGTKPGISPASLTGLVFTGDDIVSFRTGLGDMVFVEEKTAGIISRARLYSEIHFIIDGKPVFSPPIKIRFWRDSGGELDMQFCIFDDNSVQLRDATIGMNIHWVNEEASLEYAAKMQKREKELDVLVNYLNEKGKIFE